MRPIPIDHCHCDSPEVNKHLLGVEEAQALAATIVSPTTRQELVSLSSSLGRVAAKDLYAPKQMPFFDNSAMDGYAVQTTDLAGSGPFSLKIVGESAAGSQIDPVFQINTTMRIFTGAPLPRGFDAVIAQENCRVGDGLIEFEHKPTVGQNVRYEGSDVARGARLIGKGTRIAPHHIGLLAANGYSAVNVFATPRVGVFSTGDELIVPGEPLQGGQVYDCNKPLLIALLAKMGIHAVDLGALRDDSDVTREFIARNKDRFELLISSGSVSVGDRDFLKSAFEEAGGQIRSWKVAIKPGKPIMFGQLGETVFTGLPGNPFAVFVGFDLFVKPQIAKLSGEEFAGTRWQTASSGFEWKRKPGRAEVFPVRRTFIQNTNIEKLDRLGKSVSATLFPLSSADGLAIVPPDCESIHPGDTIRWHPFC